MGTDSIIVTLSKGNSTTYSPRFMLNGTSQLNYDLYLDALGAQIWGDGTGGSQEYGPVSVTNNQTLTLTVFGLIPPGQDVPSGTFGDTITATVNF